MFIELVDSLRCPRPHADSWLVGAFDRMEGRAIIQGSLGCPVCNARYAIRDGVVYFDDAARSGAGGGSHAADVPGDDRGIYLGALLGLADAQGIAVLEGGWARHGASLRALTTLPLIFLNPTVTVVQGEGVAVVHCRHAFPVAGGGVRGIALAGGAADQDLLLGAVRSLAPLGRLVAPISISRPPQIRELARDSHFWVGENESVASVPVAIRRMPPR